MDTTTSGCFHFFGCDYFIDYLWLRLFLKAAISGCGYVCGYGYVSGCKCSRSNDQVGDLGENIYVDGVDYKFFEVGKKYTFSNPSRKDDKNSVIVEITERIEPCGNLCKLRFIKDGELPAAERLKNCKKFLLFLDQNDGLRGW